MAVDYIGLGKRIKSKRVALKMSQLELAEKADISTQHVSNVENARTKVSLDKLVIIANTLGVSVDELLCDSITQSREIYQNEIITMVENFSDVEVRMVPELLQYYHGLVKRVEKNVK